MFENLFNRTDKKEEERIKDQFAHEKDLNSMQFASNQDASYLENPEKKDLVRWQQELDDELVKLRYKLKNLERDPETGTWKPKQVYLGINEFGKSVYYDMPQLCNDICIQMIETQLEPLFSRNIINSNFDEKRILKILRNTADELADNLVANFDQYDIQYSNLSAIMRIAKNAMIPAPYRALNDGERRHQRTINRRVESFNESPRQDTKRFGIF